MAAKAADLKSALDKGERKSIEKAAGDLSKAGGRNTLPGTLGSEIRGHAAATADKVFAVDNLLIGPAMPPANGPSDTTLQDENLRSTT